MMTFEQAQERIFTAITSLGSQVVPLSQACGFVLSQDVYARRSAPPCDMSAMDGYAVRARDAKAQAVLKVMGESAAGHAFDKELAQGQAVRIFTGAALPSGADSILIQENCTPIAEQQIRVDVPIETEQLYVRPKGMDFHHGQLCLKAGQLLRAQEIALLAAMNYPWVSVFSKPRVLLLCTGDELVHPGEQLDHGQIISSNGFALKALCEYAGAEVTYAGLIKDNLASLNAISCARNSCPAFKQSWPW